MTPRHSSWPDRARWAPAIVVATAIVIGVFAPPEYAGGPLLAAGCVAAGALLPFSRALLLVVGAMLATICLAAARGRLGQPVGNAELLDVGTAGLVGVAVNRLATYQRRRLEAVRTVAEQVQRVLLPPLPDGLGDLQVAARYEAAQAETRVGGDLYAARNSPHGVRLVIGDVRGKGLGAVATLSIVLGAFREAVGVAPDLPALADALEAALEREAGGDPEGGWETRFVTALLVEFPPDGHLVRLLNRGHPDPWLVKGRQVMALRPQEADLPLGLGHLAHARAEPVERPFEDGALLLMVTDGVTEARDRSGLFYEPLHRLPHLAPFDSAAGAVDALLIDLERWRHGPATDDVAVLAVRRGAASADLPS